MTSTSSLTDDRDDRRAVAASTRSTDSTPTSARSSTLDDERRTSGRGPPRRVGARSRPQRPARRAHRREGAVRRRGRRRSAYGSIVLAGRRATADAAVVAALRRAGAVVVGTTRSHEFGWGITTQHADARLDPQPVGPRPDRWRIERWLGRGGRRRHGAARRRQRHRRLDPDPGRRSAACIGLKTTPAGSAGPAVSPLAPSFDSAGLRRRATRRCSHAALAAVVGPDPADPPTLEAPALEAAGGAAGLERGAIRRRRRRRRVARPTQHASPPLATVSEALVAARCPPTRGAAPRRPARSTRSSSRCRWRRPTTSITSVLGTYPAQAATYGADVRGRLETRRRRVDLDVPRRRGDRLPPIAPCSCRRSTRSTSSSSLVGATGPTTTADPDVVHLEGTTVPLRDAVMPSTVPAERRRSSVRHGARRVRCRRIADRRAAHRTPVERTVLDLRGRRARDAAVPLDRTPLLRPHEKGESVMPRARITDRSRAELRAVRRGRRADGRADPRHRCRRHPMDAAGRGVPGRVPRPHLRQPRGGEERHPAGRLHGRRDGRRHRRAARRCRHRTLPPLRVVTRRCDRTASRHPPPRPRAQRPGPLQLARHGRVHRVQPRTAQALPRRTEASTSTTTRRCRCCSARASCRPSSTG